ncbi:MAG TPA: group 1 truncated hemoglobin [Casimicrobiaceae bacterium]|nr:group 1 truncated hemoglobin [Casimicrobiaceae bacterium]
MKPKTVVAAWLCALALAVPALAQQPGPTLYKRLGGYDALATVTDDFLSRLSTDPAFVRFFAGHSTDSIKHIRQLIVDQLCAATGGPCVYTGRDMKTAHAGLGIGEREWDGSVKHLAATLDKFNVPAKEKDEVLTTVGTLKKDIVEKP